LPLPSERRWVPLEIRVKVLYKIALSAALVLLAAEPAAARPAPEVRDDQLG
jgi:hypothetical protein